MIERNYLFPGVIEMNYQARRRMGVNVYLIDDGPTYVLIDVGFLAELSDVRFIHDLSPFLPERGDLPAGDKIVLGSFLFGVLFSAGAGRCPAP